VIVEPPFIRNRREGSRISMYENENTPTAKTNLNPAFPRLEELSIQKQLVLISPDIERI